MACSVESFRLGDVRAPAQGSIPAQISQEERLSYLAARRGVLARVSDDSKAAASAWPDSFVGSGLPSGTLDVRVYVRGVVAHGMAELEEGWSIPLQPPLLKCPDA
jgi:hypothetical protein